MDKTLNILHSMRILELKNNLNPKATEEAIKEIKELKESCELHYRLMVSAERRGVDKGILKARSIVAMLFWDMKKMWRLYSEGGEAIEMFHAASSTEICFRKAYKMLKAT